MIHEALIKCLKDKGIQAELTGCGMEEESGACFKKPACWDVMSGGRKIAGAAQRWSREGLLHQGSVLRDIGGFENYLTRSVIQFSEDWLHFGQIPKNSSS
ncbi:MAG: lipoyl protein ligase domain-containing protein [Akkermansiaceae bacterium]